MKTLLTFALLALIGLLHHNSAAPIIERCRCPHTVSRVPVPIRMIQDIVRSKCPGALIIVTTVCGRKFCLNEISTWVKELLKYFEKSKANKKSFNVSRCRN